MKVFPPSDPLFAGLKDPHGLDMEDGEIEDEDKEDEPEQSGHRHTAQEWSSPVAGTAVGKHSP